MTPVRVSQDVMVSATSTPVTFTIASFQSPLSPAAPWSISPQSLIYLSKDSIIFTSNIAHRRCGLSFLVPTLFLYLMQTCISPSQLPFLSGLTPRTNISVTQCQCLLFLYLIILSFYSAGKSFQPSTKKGVQSLPIPRDIFPTQHASCS